MNSPRFGTVLTAMVTPFGPDGSVDFGVASDLARYLVDQGSDGLVIAGSTGEGGSLSDEEKLALFECVVESVTVPVLAGTSSSNTSQSIALTTKAEATGVAGILATTPAYARPNQQGIAGHLGAIAESTSLPVMLYDIPVRTGRKIESDTTIGLVRQHSNIVALKDASGDLASAAHTKAVLGEDLDLYSGDDSLVLQFMAVGAVGVVSVAAHWAGPEFAAMVRAVEGGDWPLARSINEQLHESYGFESTSQYPNPMPSKAALRSLEFQVGECRYPLGPGDKALDAEAAKVVARLRVHRG
ncbi:MAG: 4-hydroxy-tetrahydrodipicolinate synthase [Acidimicrobiales bacterium]